MENVVKRGKTHDKEISICSGMLENRHLSGDPHPRPIQIVQYYNGHTLVASLGPLKLRILCVFLPETARRRLSKNRNTFQNRIRKLVIFFNGNTEMVQLRICNVMLSYYDVLHFNDIFMIF